MMSCLKGEEEKKTYHSAGYTASQNKQADREEEEHEIPSSLRKTFS